MPFLASHSPALWPRACLALVLLALVAGTLALPHQAHAQRNPFISTSRDNTATSSNATVALPSVVPSSLLQTVIQWQMALRTHMTRLAKEIKAHPWGRSFWLLMLFAFAYGAAHALGPGHGKAFAVAYFMERPGPLTLGLMFGNLSMFTHVASAATLVFLGTYILKTAASGLVSDVGSLLEGLSYGLLMGIGLALLGGRLFTLWRGRRQERAGHDGHTRGKGMKGLVGSALAAGIAPCPGSALVLMYCISQGVQVTGLLALVAISLGMGATISLFAMATIASRRVMLRLLHGRGRLFLYVQTGFSLLGGAAMAAMGGLLLVAWWVAR